MSEGCEAGCGALVALIVVGVFAGMTADFVSRSVQRNWKATEAKQKWHNSSEYKLRQEVKSMVKQKELIELEKERVRLREYLKKEKNKVENEGL